MAGPEDHVTLTLRGGTYRLAETLFLQGNRDSQLTLTSYPGETATLSGGRELETVQEGGEVWTAEYSGQCGDLYWGETRLVPARSPNLPGWSKNSQLARGPWNTVADLLVETQHCTK